MRMETRQAGIQYGLQPVQIEILRYLSICNQYSNNAKSVTEYLGQTKGTVSQTLKVLENKGLLVKQSDLVDKRITHLTVTAQGTKLLKDIIPSSIFTKANESLTETEANGIQEAIKTLLLTVLRSNDMKSFGICSSCRYHNKRAEGYYCALLQKPLANEEISLICREHLD